MPQGDGMTSPATTRARQEFAHRLRLAFERSGLSQIELARAVGTKQPTVSDWMNPSKEALPSTEYMMKLPKALGVTADSLFFGDQATNASPTAVQAFTNGGLAALAEVEERLRVLRESWLKEPTPPPARGADGAEREVEQRTLPVSGRRRRHRKKQA